MQSDSKFKYFPLNGELLEHLKEYRDELFRYEKEMTDLKEEFTKRSKQAHELSQGKLYQIWKKLAISTGIDPDTTWGDGRYGIESRYVDEGFGALTYTEYPPNMLDTLLSGIEQDSEDEDEDEGFDTTLPPKGTKLN